MGKAVILQEAKRLRAWVEPKYDEAEGLRGLGRLVYRNKEGQE